MVTKDRVIEELKTIDDPELHINIVDLGLVYDVTIIQDKGEVTVKMTLTSPGCPLSMVFEELVPEAVKRIEGVKSVYIDLVWDPPWDPDKMSDEQKEQLGLLR